MMIVRPVQHDDLTSLESLVNASDARLSTLPGQRDQLSARIALSEASFGHFEANAQEQAHHEQYFLFVLENTETGELVGSAAVEASAGRGEPFYNYRQDELIHASRQLNIHNRVPVLYMTHELTGKTLLCSFTLRKDYRATPYFKLLSRARLLFIAQFSSLFADQVVVEIQGVQDARGESPFWDSLGRHFFNMDFATADYYSAVKSRTFIAELMPSNPIYVPLLTNDAQAAINASHPATEESCQLFYREGMQISNYIDIFDGGPVLTGRKQELTTIKGAQSKEVLLSDSSMGPQYLISNGKFEDFRCLLGQFTDGLGSRIRLSEALLRHLGCEAGSHVMYAPL